MNKQIFIFSLLLVIVVPFNSSAQRWKLRRYEASAGPGTVNFFGDIGGTAADKNMAGFKDIQLRYTRPSLVLGGTYKLRGDMHLKMNLIFGAIAGDDLESRNDGRNFAFTSTIFEPSLQFEYYLLPEGKGFSSSAIFNKRGMINNYAQFSVYVFAGVGGIYSNPKPKKDYVTVFNDNFSKFGVAFPAGLGIKYSIDSQWSLGFELGRRFTLTDYIDGYTSEFSKHKDTYYIGAITAIYKIRTDRRGVPSFKRSYR